MNFRLRSDCEVLAKTRSLHHQQHRPYRHQNERQLESDGEIEIAGGEEQFVARDVENQRAVDEPEDQRLAVVPRLAQTIDRRHKALADSGDDQRAKAQQLDIAQRAVNQRDAHHHLVDAVGCHLGKKEQVANDGLNEKPEESRRR